MHRRKKVHKKVISYNFMKSYDLNDLLFEVVLFSDFRMSIKFAQSAHAVFTKYSCSFGIPKTMLCSESEFHILAFFAISFCVYIFNLRLFFAFFSLGFE